MQTVLVITEQCVGGLGYESAGSGGQPDVGLTAVPGG